MSAYKLGVNDMKAEGLIDRLYNEDSVGLIFTGYDTINEYVQEKTLVGGTLTKTDKGWKFTLMDTMLGDDEESKEAAKKVLENAGVDPETGKISKAAFTEQGISFFYSGYSKHTASAFGTISFTYGDGGKINADVDLNIKTSIGEEPIVLSGTKEE